MKPSAIPFKKPRKKLNADGKGAETTKYTTMTFSASCYAYVLSENKQAARLIAATTSPKEPARNQNSGFTPSPLSFLKR
jgi:hypothetical protein